MEISAVDEFMALIARELSPVFTVHVGEAIILVPINVAQLVVFVGVMVEGNTILRVPDEERTSNVVILI